MSVSSPVTARALLLQALTQGPAYEVDLLKWVVRQSKGQVHLRQGDACPLLLRMEREGLVKGYERQVSLDATINRDVRRPPPRFYKLTKEGSKKAQENRGIIANLFFFSRKPKVADAS